MAIILLIEPHPLLRLGLRHLLAQAHIPGDLVDIDPLAPPESDTWLHHADLLVFGLAVDHGVGWAELADTCQRLRPQRVLVLAEAAQPSMPASGVPDAVRGCLAKTCCADAMDAAIRLVLAGGECFPSRLAGAPHAQGADAPMHNGHASGRAPGDTQASVGHAPAVVVPLHAGVTEGAVAVSPPPVIAETPTAGAHLLNITERQYEVLALLARGYPIKTVSRLLNISVATAKTHACTLYQRLHVRNKGEAVYVALQRGAVLNWNGPHPAASLKAPAPASSACQAA